MTHALTCSSPVFRVRRASLSLPSQRGLSRQAIGRPVIGLGKNTERPSRAPIEIEAGRQRTLEVMTVGPRPP